MINTNTCKTFWIKRININNFSLGNYVAFLKTFSLFPNVETNVIFLYPERHLPTSGDVNGYIGPSSDRQGMSGDSSGHQG